MLGNRYSSWTVSVDAEASRIMLIQSGWLSPELYLRRPPKLNEQFRLDRMLQAAAARGVKVNIIVYKEVTQALTCKLTIACLVFNPRKLMHSPFSGFASYKARP